MSASERCRPPEAPAPRDRRDEPTDELLSALLVISDCARRICRDTTERAETKQLARNILEICERASDGFRSLDLSPRPLHQAPPIAPFDALSAREREIFSYLAEGQTPCEIARRLSRSSKTVHNHRTRILQKLGLRNSADLVRLALRAGLVSL